MTPLRAAIAILEGPDAQTFAGTRFSSDIAALDDGAWQWSAWLDAQGRVRVFMHLVRVSDTRFLLILRGGDAPAFIAAIQPYVLRSRVTLQALPPRMPIDTAAMPSGTTRLMDDDIILGCGDYAMRLPAVDPTMPAQDWRRHAIRAGHPWLPETLDSRPLSAALDLDRLGATRFGKGCYPGQEIAARLHFRGGCKYHLRLLQGPVALPPGERLRHQGSAVGAILDSIEIDAGHFLALAVLRDSLADGENLFDIGHAPHGGSRIVVGTPDRTPGTATHSRI